MGRSGADDLVVRFGDDRGWRWRFFPAQALLMLVVAGVLVVWEWFAGRDMGWRDLLLGFGVFQALGLMASTIMVGLHAGRKDVAYLISSRTISCEVAGQVTRSIDPAEVRSWRLDDRLYRWADHLALPGSRLQFRRDGVCLHLWCRADFGVTETTFAPLIIFDRDTYTALIAAVEDATGLAREN